MCHESLLPGRLLRQALPPEPVDGWPGLDIRDERLAAVLAPDTPLHHLYQFTLHGEGTIWQARLAVDNGRRRHPHLRCGGVKLGFVSLPATPSNCCFGLHDMSRFFVAGQKFLWSLDLRG